MSINRSGCADGRVDWQTIVAHQALTRNVRTNGVSGTTPRIVQVKPISPRVLLLLLTIGAACDRPVLIGRIYPAEQITSSEPGAETTPPSTAAPIVCTQEICNGLDDDCDGNTDQGCDDDGDGACDATFVVTAGSSCVTSGDCDDDGPNASLRAPNRVETCFDGIDNDCDGTFDEQDLDAGCEPIVFQLTPPTFAIMRESHAKAFPLRADYAPHVATVPTWSVRAVSGGTTCALSDLQELSSFDVPGSINRLLALQPAIARDPGRIGCRYEIDVTIGSAPKSSFAIIVENAPPGSVSIVNSEQNNGAFELRAAAGTTGGITANAIESEADHPMVFRWSDASTLPATTCVPSCDFSHPSQSMLPFAGPLVVGDYSFTLGISDTLGASTSPIGVSLLVRNCVWVTQGGTGIADGSSPANAFATIGAALSAAAAMAQADVCIAGSGTFNENVTLTTGLSTPALRGGFDSAGETSALRPTITLAGASLQMATGGAYRIERVILSGATPVIAVTDATLALFEVDIDLNASSGAVGVALSSVTQTSVVRATKVFASASTGCAAATAFALDGADASLLLKEVVGSLVGCTDELTFVRASNDANVEISGAGIELSAVGDTILVDTVAPTAASRVTITNTQNIQLNSNARAIAVRAPGGVLSLVRNQSIQVYGDVDGKVVEASQGASVTIEDNTTLFAFGRAGEAITIDLTGTLMTPLFAPQINRNADIRASGFAFGLVPTARVASIRLHHTNDAVIANNASISVGTGGFEYGAAIMDGSASVTGTITPGGSTGLRIESNGAITGGNGDGGLVDCTVDPRPSTSNVSVGIMLVGTSDVFIGANGRPARNQRGIAGGAVRAYADLTLQRLAPVVTGVWLVGTTDVTLDGNEVYGGRVVTEAQPQCLPLADGPASVSVLDGLPQNPVSGAPASDGSLRLTLRRNGLKCAHLPNGVAAMPPGCIAVWANASTDFLLENNVLAASEGDALVALRLESGAAHTVQQNYLRVASVVDGGGVLAATTLSKRAIELHNVPAASVLVAHNILRVVAEPVAISEDAIVISDSVSAPSAARLSQLWGNLFDLDPAFSGATALRLFEPLPRDVAFSSLTQAVPNAAYNEEGRAGLLEFSSLVLVAGARRTALSLGLNLAPPISGAANVDIEGEARSDNLIDAGHDELVRQP